MKDKCKAELIKRAGRNLSKAEIDGIEERMRAAMRELMKKDPAKTMAMSLDQRLTEATKIAKDWMMKDVVRAHEQSLQEASRLDALLRTIRSQAPGLKNGQTQVLKLMIRSTEVRMEALKKNFYTLGTGLSSADTGKYLGLVSDPKATFEVVKAIWGDTNVSPEAKTFADNINKMLDFIADTFQRHGLSLNKLEDYRTPQPQEPSKLADAKKEIVNEKGEKEIINEWVESHLTWVDRQKYINSDGTLMNDKQMRTFLGEVYETILTDGANKRADGEASGGSMIVGGNKNKPRRLFYKNAESWNSAMQKYGRTTNLYELLASHVHGMSKDIAMAQTFGRNAEKNFRKALAVAAKNDLDAAKSTKEHERISALSKNVNHLFDAYTKPDPLVNPRLAKWGDNVRAWFSASFLGNSWTAALGDVGIMHHYARIYNLPAIKEFAQNVKNMIPDAERADFLQKLGLWNEGFMQANRRVAEENYSSNFGHFLSSATNKLMMQNAWDRGMVTGFGMVLQNTMGRLTRKFASLADVGEEGKILQRLGVTDDHFNVWRLADLVKGYGADSLLSPRAIYDIADEKLAPLVEARVKARSESLKAEIDKRNAQTEKEKQWYTTAWEKFEKARDRANRMLREFDERRQKYVGEAKEVADANAELLRAKLERAEVEHDIAGYLKTETAQDRIQRFLERVEDGENVERQLVKERDHPDRLPDAVVERYQKTPSIGERAAKGVEDYGRSINRTAENLGARRARTEARIKAAEKRIEEMGKKYDAEVQRKANAVDKRFAAALKDLQEMGERYKERAAKRKEYADAFQAKVGKVLGEETLKAKDEAAVKLLEVVHHHTRRALRGSSAANTEDRVALGLTKWEAGTILGEAWRFALQFKSVPIGVFKTQMDVLSEMDAHWTTKAAYFARFAASATLPAALGLQIRALLSGQDPNDMDFTTEEGAKFWLKAMLSGGGLGIYGDLITAGQTPYGRDPLAVIAGPGIGIGIDALQTITGSPSIIGDVADGDDETDRNYGLEALQFTRRNFTPFANIWYVKGAFNRMVYDQMQEMLEPGTVDKHIQRMERNGSSYFWQPGQPLPDRAPDLTKAYEE